MKACVLSRAFEKIKGVFWRAGEDDIGLDGIKESLGQALASNLPRQVAFRWVRVLHLTT